MFFYFLTIFCICYFQDCLPILMGFVQNSHGDDALRLASLVVLTNIATISEWHEDYCPLLHR